MLISEQEAMRARVKELESAIAQIRAELARPGRPRKRPMVRAVRGLERQLGVE